MVNRGLGIGYVGYKCQSMAGRTMKGYTFYSSDYGDAVIPNILLLAYPWV
jgi:hypothetical protein